MGSKMSFDATPGDRFSTKKAYRGMEDLLLSYNDLVRIGRIKEGKRYAGLEGGESRFSRAMAEYQQGLAAADPAFGRYKALIDQGLEGVETGGIPNDFRRSITENLRQAQASRGILDSDTAAIEEAVRLTGGQEAIRAARMNEIGNYFGQVIQPGLAAFMPNMGAEFQSAQMNNQRAQAGFNNRMNAYEMGIGLGSDVVGAVTVGMMGGGGMGAAAGGMAGTAGAAPVDPWGGASYPAMKYGGAY